VAAPTRASRPIRWGEPWPLPEARLAACAYTPEEQRELEEQLVALGYI